MASAEVEESSQLLLLPEEILEQILSKLPYEDISYTRRVCHKVDRLCQSLLNNGYTKVDKFHGECQRKVRAQLPRRESERRNHPLARHVDILAAIETRLSLLGMTFMKYVDMGLCCFIPGKVLDEIFRVLHFIETTKTPPRAHELLQELRDISSMAMEHFDEKIVPILKKKIPPVTLGMNSSFPGPSLDGHSCITQGPSPLPLPEIVTSHASVSQLRLPVMRQEILQLKHHQRTTSSNVNIMRKEFGECKVKISEFGKQFLEQEKKTMDQNRVISEQNRKLADQEKVIGDLNRKILEYDQKFVDLMAEFSRVRSSIDSVNNSGLHSPVCDSKDPNGNPVLGNSCGPNDSGMGEDDIETVSTMSVCAKRKSLFDNDKTSVRKRRALRDDTESSASGTSIKKLRH